MIESSEKSMHFLRENPQRRNQNPRFHPSQLLNQCAGHPTLLHLPLAPRVSPREGVLPSAPANISPNRGRHPTDQTGSLSPARTPTRPSSHRPSSRLCRSHGARRGSKDKYFATGTLYLRKVESKNLSKDAKEPNKPHRDFYLGVPYNI